MFGILLDKFKREIVLQRTLN